MFDNLGEAGLLAEMSAALRDERASTARRLLAAGRLCQLRMADSAADDADRSQWCIDNWEAVAAEVGAELGVSRGRASSQMSRGLDLLERFPKLAVAFAAGEVDFRVVAVALFRTGLITDPDVLDAIDTALARCAPGWNALSQKRLTEYVDWRVRELDPAAERVARESHADRHVGIGPGPGGLADLWGRLAAPDAALFDRRLDDLAATVCRGDSRTREQRGADAVGALAAGATSLECDCGLTECPAREVSAPLGQIVIHLLAEAATVSGAGDRPGLLPGYGAVPAKTVRGLRRRARLRPMASPERLGTERRYRPSTALADFIRARDLCCRFPGCDAPAAVCDIDHTVPHGCGGRPTPRIWDCYAVFTIC